MWVLPVKSVEVTSYQNLPPEMVSILVINLPNLFARVGVITVIRTAAELFLNSRSVTTYGVYKKCESLGEVENQTRC